MYNCSMSPTGDRRADIGHRACFRCSLCTARLHFWPTTTPSGCSCGNSASSIRVKLGRIELPYLRPSCQTINSQCMTLKKRAFYPLEASHVIIVLLATSKVSFSTVYYLLNLAKLCGQTAGNTTWGSSLHLYLLADHPDNLVYGRGQSQNLCILCLSAQALRLTDSDALVGHTPVSLQARRPFAGSHPGLLQTVLVLDPKTAKQHGEFALVKQAREPVTIEKLKPMPCQTSRVQRKKLSRICPSVSRTSGEYNSDCDPIRTGKEVLGESSSSTTFMHAFSVWPCGAAGLITDVGACHRAYRERPLNLLKQHRSLNQNWLPNHHRAWPSETWLATTVQL